MKELKFSVTDKGQVQAYEYRRRSARWFRVKLTDAESWVDQGIAKVQDPRKAKIW